MPWHLNIKMELRKRSKSNVPITNNRKLRKNVSKMMVTVANNVYFFAKQKPKTTKGVAATAVLDVLNHVPTSAHGRENEIESVQKGADDAAQLTCAKVSLRKNVVPGAIVGVCAAVKHVYDKNGYIHIKRLKNLLFNVHDRGRGHDHGCLLLPRSLCLKLLQYNQQLL